MYPKQAMNHSYKMQRGFLIPLALFIVVVIGFLALVITRTSTQTNAASVQELLSVQTFYAAESGAQKAMQLLFFPDARVRQTVDNRCATMSQTYNFGGIVGLQHCSAQVSCLCRYSNGAACAPATATNYAATTTVPNSFYTITSIASCGQAAFRAERTIQAGAFLEQELTP